MRTFSVLDVFGVRLEQLQQPRRHVHPAPLHLDEPGLVVQPGRDDVHLPAVQRLVGTDQPFLLRPQLDAAGDLPVRALHAVAQADGLHAAVLVAGPGVHRHRVRVVQEEGVRLGDLADVLAEVEQFEDGALRVHDAAGAERVAHALIHAVLQRDVDVELERLQPALADRGDDVVAVGDGLAAVHGRDELGGHAAGFQIAAAQLAHHVQVALGNVHEGEDGIGELRHGDDVAHQAAGEADGSGADHGDFDWHG